MISVCLASYNGERYIREQIVSILNQLSSDDELIISDDGSTDNTLLIINEFNDSRIKLYANTVHADVKSHSKSHYRVTKNFENALGHVLGDYIFLADQDDVWEADKVDITISALQHCSLVMSNYSVIDGDGISVQNFYYRINPIHHCFFRNLIDMPFHGCCMAFRKEILSVVLPFPRNLVMHDNWIGISAAFRGFDIEFIEKPLIKYRRHQFNVSPSSKGSTNPIWFKIWYRIVFAMQIIFYYFRK